LLSRTVTPGAASGKALALPGDALLPDNGRLVFSVETASGVALTAADSIDIAPADESAAIRLTTATGLRLEGPQIAIASLDPKAVAPALFGPLRFRLRHGDAVSDWQPLVTLARLPQIEAVTCERAGAGCTIRGRDLFLIDAVGATPGLDRAAEVAHGYTGSTLTVPRPSDGKLYVRLRDAPDTVVTLPVA
ncbi:MAG: hypothetical protein WAO77_15480, partial [Sphingobium sp.]